MHSNTGLSTPDLIVMEQSTVKGAHANPSGPAAQALQHIGIAHVRREKHLKYGKHRAMTVSVPHTMNLTTQLLRMACKAAFASSTQVYQVAATCSTDSEHNRNGWHEPMEFPHTNMWHNNLAFRQHSMYRQH
jgi:hypothetical protein